MGFQDCRAHKLYGRTKKNDVWLLLVETTCSFPGYSTSNKHAETI